MAAPLSAYEVGPTTTQNWVVRKPAARGRRGVVVSQSRIASGIGAEILAAGGSAADAAIGMALALSCAEPWNSGLGGVGFGLVRGAGGEVQVLDFGPVAPGAAEPRLYPLEGVASRDIFGWPKVMDDRNVHGPLSFCVPSAVAGYGLLHARHGRLPWQEILAPAVAEARRGLTKDWFSTVKIAQCAAVLRRYPTTAAIYLPDGLPPIFPEQGLPAYLPQGNHAATLERLRLAGAGDFYAGDIARDLLADFAEAGALVSADDLARCTPRLDRAAAVDWRGRGTLYHAGGLTAGPTLERILSAMDGVAAGQRPDAAWFAAAAQAMKSAYRERLASAGAASPAPGQAEGPATCTSHLCAIDADGMTVSLTTTLLSLMGSGVVLPRTGVLMNNGMMWFDPRPGTPNAIAGGRRPLSNMLPVLFESRDGRTVLAGGASGGRRILASVYQMLAFLLDFGMTLEEAAHHPRLDVSGPASVGVDRRLGAEIFEAILRDGPAQQLEHAAAPLNFACPSFATAADGEQAGISDCMTPWSAAVAVP